MSEQYINVRTVHGVPGPYGLIQRASADTRYISRRELKQTVKNARDVLQWPGASYAVIDTDNAVAIQVSGYTTEAGLYCHVFTECELAPYTGGVEK